MKKLSFISNPIPHPEYLHLSKSAFFTILTATNKEFSSVGSLLPTYFQKCFSMYMLTDFPWVNNYLVLNNFLQILLIFCYQYSLMLQQGDLAISLRNPLDFHN